MAKLKDFCAINPKAPILADDLEVSFVPMPKVGEQGEFDPSETREYREVKKGFTNFQNGDVLFAKITPCMENGKGAVANSLKNGYGFGSTEFHVLRPDYSKATSEWLYYLTIWNEFRKEAESNMTGSAGQKRVPKTFLENYEVNLPELQKQKEMADVLDHIRKLISLRKEQLAKLDQLVKSRFIELFGDPVSNPKRWDKIALGKRCEIITGNTPSRAEPENYGEYIEWIKSDNINTPFTLLTQAQECLSETGFKKCRFVEAGSLLMTCIAGSVSCIGNVAVSDRRVAFNQQINAIVPKRDEVLYLYWLMLLSKPAIHSTINKALKGILSKGQLSEMAFPFPPKELQEQFAAFVEQTDKSKLTIQQSLDKLELLKKSLMQEYFG